MATAVTAEEIARLIKDIDDYRKKIASDPKEAKRFLRAVGIHNRKGELTKPYRK